MTVFGASNATGGLHRIDDSAEISFRVGAVTRETAQVWSPVRDDGANSLYGIAGEDPGQSGGITTSSGAAGDVKNLPRRYATPGSVPDRREAPVGSTLGRRRRVWPMLADDMFRMAHRDRDGSCWLDGRMAGFAMAAALLAELVLTEHLTVEGGLVRVLDATAPSDVVAHTVLAQVDGERVEHPVRTWLAFLADKAYEDVAERLVRGGYVEARVSRRLLHRAVRYVPTDRNVAAWPWARLNDALRRGRPLSTSSVALGGLALATDLHRVALVGEASAFGAAMSRLVDELPEPIRELIMHTKAAAGDAVITST